MADNQQISDRNGSKASGRATVALIVFVGIIAVLMFMNDATSYLWLKALHVIAVISWMAGLVYLPRLFVYHTDAAIGSDLDQTFIVMERRLLKVIMTPAMLISWVLGLWLAWSGGHLAEFWFAIKFVSVLALTATHGFFAKSARLFQEGKNVKSAKQWRLYNEIPTVLMILIVIMVVIKPF